MTRPPLPRRIDECIAELRARGCYVRIIAPSIGAPAKCHVIATANAGTGAEKEFLGLSLSAALRRAVIWARKETEE